jgi:hypothetical protein
VDNTIIPDDESSKEATPPTGKASNTTPPAGTSGIEGGDDSNSNETPKQ